MVQAWLLSDRPSQHTDEAKVDFPITRHGCLPADRVFGAIEKESLKFGSITTIHNYPYSRFLMLFTYSRIFV